MAGEKLTPKQEIFVREYLVDLNAKQAAIRAGYSERTAEKIGSENLHKPEVRAVIEQAMASRAEKTDLTAERVLREIQCMAFWDAGDLMISEDAGDGMHDVQIVDGKVIHGLRNPADIKRLPENLRRAIIGWGWDRNQNFTVKLADKSKALDQLARHLSLYNDKLEVTGVDALADRLSRAKERKG